MALTRRHCHSLLPLSTAMLDVVGSSTPTRPEHPPAGVGQGGQEKGFRLELGPGKGFRETEHPSARLGREGL